MRIVSATLRRVRLPLVHEFQTSSHRKNHLEHLLVELEDESGAVGWGEIAAASAPYYNAENVQTCWLVASEYLLPQVLGIAWDRPEQVSALWRRVRGNEFAKAGVDMAAWALWSQYEGVPLARALGGTRSEVVAGVSLGIEPTIDDLLEQVAVHVAHGYPRVKLKIAPGWDIEPVRAVRGAFGDLDLHVDANGVYTESAEHLTALRGLDDFGLTMIEQPFAPRDLLAHARFQRTVRTPVCLDESVETLADLELALELDAGRVLNIKVSRMGGLTAAVAAHGAARARGLPVWCGGMHEFGVGRAANVALSSLPGFTLPSDVSGSDKYYARDVIVPPVVADHGVVQVPTGPGLGFDVDLDYVTQMTQQTLRLDERG
ncbi:MAG: o-succinylbenzoate synthase [Cellulomonadaceae bacterium]